MIVTCCRKPHRVVAFETKERDDIPVGAISNFANTKWAVSDRVAIDYIGTLLNTKIISNQFFFGVLSALSAFPTGLFASSRGTYTPVRC